MGMIIDIVAVLIMLLFTYIGYKRGLIKVAISFLSVIVSILIALVLYRPVAQQIAKSTQIDEKISDTIYSKINYIDFNNMTEEEKSSNGIIAIAEKQIKEAIENSAEDAARYVADSLTLTIVEGISFIGLLILLRIILLVLNLFADFIGNLPIIRQFNKSGGLVYGIVEGLLVLNLILAMAYIINPIWGEGKIQETVEKSTLGKILYEKNIIINTILK